MPTPDEQVLPGSAGTSLGIDLERRLDRVEQVLRGGAFQPPPDDLHPTGDGDYFMIGLEFLRHFVECGGLEPGDKVLEIGSGLGRMALPLACFLEDGEYIGVEISRASVDWCTRHITSGFPNVGFSFLDIRHPLYNPAGTVVVDRSFRFPYEDAQFDFVFLTSVFTHLTRFEVKKYLTEIRRLLKPGGRLFATFFVAPAEHEGAFDSFDQRFRFEDTDLHNTYYSAPPHPLAAVAYDEAFILDMLDRLGFGADVQLHRGAWHSGESAMGNYQDMIVATRGD